MDEWFRGQVGQPMLTLSFITISFLIQLGLSFITISLSFFKIKYREEPRHDARLRRAEDSEQDLQALFSRATCTYGRQYEFIVRLGLG